MPCVALLPLLHSSLELIYSHGTCMYISVVHSLHVFAIREKMAECSFEHGQSFIFCLFVLPCNTTINWNNLPKEVIHVYVPCPLSILPEVVKLRILDLRFAWEQGQWGMNVSALMCSIMWHHIHSSFKLHGKCSSATRCIIPPITHSWTGIVLWHE